MVGNLTFKHSKGVPQGLKRLIYSEYGGLCQICFRPIIGEWDCHHVVPVKDGGPTILSNLIPTHPECHNWPMKKWKGTEYALIRVSCGRCRRIIGIYNPTVYSKFSRPCGYCQSRNLHIEIVKGTPVPQ